MLLRLNWLESRKKLVEEFPCDVWILPNRPSFGRNKEGKIGTDATAYAWFHWSPATIGIGTIGYCAETPKDVRKAYREYLDKTLPAQWGEAAA